MNLNDLKKEIRKQYHGPIVLEEFISHEWRKKFEVGFLSLWIVGFILLLTTHLTDFTKLYSSYGKYINELRGFTGISFVLWLKFFLLESFYYSFYFKNQREGELDIDLDLSKIIWDLDGDVTKSFFKTDIGKMVLLRAGIPQKEFNNFLNSRKNILNESNFNLTYSDNLITISDLAVSLLDNDTELRDFFFGFGIQKKEFFGILEWIIELHEERVYRERWWGRDNLLRTQSFGRDWSYGQIYTLKKYERPLVSSGVKRYKIHSSYGVKELLQIEEILSKAKEANVCLVGDDESGKIQILTHLRDMIEDGKVMGALQHKRIVVIDTQRFSAINSTKSDFEKEFTSLMQEAWRAGNIILVFLDLPGFMRGAQSLGSDLPALLEVYLTTSNIQIVTASDVSSYHSVIEKNGILVESLDKVQIKEIDDTNTIKVLENEIVPIESHGLFFTYTALLTLVESAERYFPDGVMPDKAVDLLLEISPKLLANKKSVVLKQDILELVESKTGIPVSGVNADEKNKLLDLENILHKRIVGQNEAIDSISKAVRRARSGINNPNRPLASFLFLGPTGVGKTETTKALADVFFGKEANILRLDMSEYSASDSVAKLIGSFESGRAGVLATMVKEHPYGVLLLDEFEKTTKEVMNLFLQILDEGFFSDGNGKKVNTRNLIIIATSNAGSEIIWDTMREGGDVSKIKDTVVDSIIKQGLYKPELVNRFDGVVLFHPLTDSDIRKIAELGLNKLHDRLTEKGINLVINQDLIDYVVSFGSDPKFGARPLARAIQEKVEEIIAKKIIEGSAKPGSKLELSKSDLV